MIYSCNIIITLRSVFSVSGHLNSKMFPHYSLHIQGLDRIMETLQILYTFLY
jgi:hypothetical protein